MVDGKRGTYPGQHEHFISENTTLLLSPSSRQICMVSHWALAGVSWAPRRTSPSCLPPPRDCFISVVGTEVLEQIPDLSQLALSPVHSRRKPSPISCLSVLLPRAKRPKHSCKEAAVKMKGILDRGNYTWLDRCSGMGRESQSYALVILQGVSKGKKAI